MPEIWLAQGHWLEMGTPRSIRDRVNLKRLIAFLGQVPFQWPLTSEPTISTSDRAGAYTVYCIPKPWARLDFDASQTW